MHFRFTSITDMLEKQAQSRAHQSCLLYPDQTDPHKYATLTYKQLNEVTNHLAQKFAAQIECSPTNKTSVVCLLANSNVSYLLSIYALLKLNVIVFPLSIRNSDAAIMHMLENSNVSHLFYSNQYSSVALKINIKFGVTINLHSFEEIRIAEIVELGESMFKPTVDTDELERVRIIFHSSGSTSFPKPIRLATRCLFGYFETYALEMNKCFWTDDDTVLAVQPLFHMGGVSISIALWYVGGAYAMPLTSFFPPSPSELFASIQYPKITKLFTVAVFLEQLIRLLRQDDNIGFKAVARLKFVAYGGAACPAHICRELVEQGVNLITTYGSTETGFVLISDCDAANKHRWQWMRPMLARQSSVKFLQVSLDSNINELILLPNDPFLAPDLAANDSYSPGDLFIEDPPGSGYYIIQGRKDDILVHTTGEKTNPLPMELAMRQHAIIDHAIVLGHQRFCCSVLIQLNLDEAFQHELRTIEDKVLTAVKAANNDAPTHSHVVPALVKILPMAKRLPITGKGNIIRKSVELEYNTMIGQMYEQFFNRPGTDSNTKPHLQERAWTRAEICHYLQKTVADVLKKPFEIFADHSTSLFSLSLNSLTAMELLNALCLEFGQLDQNVIFEFSSIDTLGEELLCIVNKQQSRISNDPRHYQETEEIIDKYIDLIRTHQNQKSMALESLKSDEDTNSRGDRIFLVTGANGSLGTQVLLHLLDKPNVRRIYCLLRGDDPAERLRSAMQARKQDYTVLLDTTRITILPMNLSDETLGQTALMYDQMQSEVTDIIHSAWKMDFNMTIKDFDRECLRGLYYLLKFARASSTRLPMCFHYISSIGSAGSGLVEEIKEEPLPRHIEIAIAQGYGQAKYAGEHICWAAMNLWGVPVDIYRLGQIAGDSETGVWNTAEMIPLIMCGGSNMGMLPDDCQRVDWIPVNYCAACIADIAVDTSTRTAPTTERVHHILNPHTISWSELLENLKMAGLHFTVVPINDWLRVLLSNPKNPAYVLAGFFHKIFSAGKNFELAKYLTEKTARRTAAFERCPIINRELVQRYLNYWLEIGFLKQGYSHSA